MPTSEPPGTVEVGEGEGLLVATGDEWISVLRLELDGKYVPAESALAPGTVLADG